MDYGLPISKRKFWERIGLCLSDAKVSYRAELTDIGQGQTEKAESPQKVNAYIIIIIKPHWNFLGGPVAKTPGSQCRGPGFYS